MCPYLLDLFCSDLQQWMIKAILYFIQEKKMIKSFPGAQGQKKVPEFTEGLALLSSSTLGLKQHRWVVFEVIKCLGR